MPVVLFDQDDEAYFRWMDAHPEGYVVNTGRTQQSNYFLIHRSHCAHISRSKWRVPGAFTERTYIKACSRDPRELAEWGRRNRSLNGRPFSSTCNSCDPIPDGDLPQATHDYPDEIPAYEAEKLTEGAKSTVTVNRYERDPRARKLCIRHYGATCHVCAFDFSRVYGPVGDGFIHVHHLKPLSAINGSYEVDPIRDLRPVCPNCHAMLHRGEEPMSLPALKRIMKEHQR